MAAMSETGQIPKRELPPVSCVVEGTSIGEDSDAPATDTTANPLDGSAVADEMVMAGHVGNVDRPEKSQASR